MDGDRVYLCIDLKSFYASVECVERGLDPMKANLVVADPERDKGTSGLAVTPAMRELGVKNRGRVYEIPATIPYIMAPPRMKLYIRYAAEIYGIYLRYMAKEDIHVYSVDEAFFDAAPYLSMYRMGAEELALLLMRAVKEETGITASAGAGTNLFLAKAALDILAKHKTDHFSYLDEERFRRILWDHRPLTDFWRIGAGMEKRLQSMGLYTMKDIAQADEAALYRMFGVDAEILIDHAWGQESVTMADIKNYRPKSSSISSSQVLLRDYSYEEGALILRQMTDALCLEMLERGVVTRSVTLVVGYSYVTQQRADRGTVSLPSATNLYRMILPPLAGLYENMVKKTLPIRKISITCNRVREEGYEQLSLFQELSAIDKERRLQRAVMEVKSRYGKNALIRGRDLLEAGTAMRRNEQIGGHRSGD